MVLQVLAGMLLGSALTSGIWGYFVKTGKSRSEALQRERDDIMHSIGEIWVEIDSLFSSYRCGIVDDKGFHDTFAAKIETINQQLKPNLHLFDVYYVKYLENQIEQYCKTAHYTGMTQPITKGTAADHELETSYAVIGKTEIQEKPEAVVSTEESTFSVKEEHPAEPEHSENMSPEAVIEEMVDAGILSDAKGGMKGTVSEQSDGETAIPETSEVDSDREKAVLPDEPEKTDTRVNKKQPKHATAAKVEAPVENEEVFDISMESSSSEEEPTEAASEDGMFDVVIAEKERSNDLSLEMIDETSADTAADKKEEAEASLEKSVETVSAEQVKIPESAIIPKSDVELEVFDNEDFTMETLMDVDVNTISPYIESEKASVDLKDVQSTKKETGKEMGDDLEVVIASNASHSDSSTEDARNDMQVNKAAVSIHDHDDIPEETTYTPVGELEKRTVGTEKPEDLFSEAEEFEVTIDEDAPESTSDTALPVDETASAEEMTFFESELVTGDDVADTIAALEGTNSDNSKPSEKNKTKSEKNISKTTKSKKKKEPVAVTEKKGAVEVKKKDGEESITGDDVADQIDEFFGLIE